MLSVGFFVAGSEIFWDVRFVVQGFKAWEFSAACGAESQCHLPRSVGRGIMTMQATTLEAVAQERCLKIE